MQHNVGPPWCNSCSFKQIHNSVLQLIIEYSKRMHGQMIARWTTIHCVYWKILSCFSFNIAMCAAISSSRYIGTFKPFVLTSLISPRRLRALVGFILVYAVGFILVYAVGFILVYAVGFILVYAVGFILVYAVGFILVYAVGFILVYAVGFILVYAVGFILVYAVGFILVYADLLALVTTSASHRWDPRFPCRLYAVFPPWVVSLDLE